MRWLSKKIAVAVAAAAVGLAPRISVAEESAAAAAAEVGKQRSWRDRKEVVVGAGVAAAMVAGAGGFALSRRDSPRKDGEVNVGR